MENPSKIIIDSNNNASPGLWGNKNFTPIASIDGMIPRDTIFKYEIKGKVFKNGILSAFEMK